MNSFGARSTLSVGGAEYQISRLAAVTDGHVEKLPFSLKILLENLLRNEDGTTVTGDDIRAIANWDPKAAPSTEIAYRPARVLLQDFTGVPAVVDLAAMRDAMKRLGGDPKKINPLSPAELVIDHSVQVDTFAREDAYQRNVEFEYMRNKERYQFLKWGQKSFDNFRVVPPGMGIVHQVNIEHLARVVFQKPVDGGLEAYPDTVVGTDSHTTMVNGLGVLGWGVGGIEAEAALLGQPVTMLVPQVIGFELTGSLAEGATATDLVLMVTEMLREKGVVGKFVEFYGAGLGSLPLADRATLGNMSPEFGSTCAIFPIDGATLDYLRLTARPAEQIALVEAYAKEQGLWRQDGASAAEYSDTLSLDMGSVEPSLAGPKRPQDRVPLKASKTMFTSAYDTVQSQRGADAGGLATAAAVKLTVNGTETEIRDGAVVIAAITSCTNTSNPAVMIGAGLVAKKAVEKGLQAKPWVKTSLAPGSKVVTDYLAKSGLDEHLDLIGFHLVGYGCTTCIGNSGPLPPEVSAAIKEGDLTVCSVLSGNRNFEGRVHSEVRMNYLASPPLVVAYALAGTMDIDLYSEPLGQDLEGKDVFLKDLWPTQKEIQDVVGVAVTPEMFDEEYAKIYEGTPAWQELDAEASDLYPWADDSTYVRHPPYFEDMGMEPAPVKDILNARVLLKLGDSVTTDHISPAGQFKADHPAGEYLVAKGVPPKSFNSYGSRRGNHEVMMRGTFANVRLRNQLAPGTEGGWTVHQPSGEQMSIFDASEKYKADGVPTIVLGGSEYGSGSSRDWAAKGPRLLGLKAVIAVSYERIHRSNLIGMGVLPLEFVNGESADSLGLSGKEVFGISGLKGGEAKQVQVSAKAPDGEVKMFLAKVRLDTPQEVLYYQHGGILHYVLRGIAAG